MPAPDEFFVIKRDGSQEPVHFDKITERLKTLITEMSKKSKAYKTLSPAVVTQKIASQLAPTMHTQEIDMLAAETCASMVRTDPEYDGLAARIVLSNIMKIAPKSFSAAMEAMNEQCSMPVGGVLGGYMNDEFMGVVRACAGRIDEHLRATHDRVYTCETNAAAMMWFKKYCHQVAVGEGAPEESAVEKKPHETFVETPLYVLMRVAIAVELGDGRGFSLERAFEAYDLMSLNYYTHATPTLFNAGKRVSQCASCFLLTVTDDSIEGIYETLKRCALVSQGAGGVGLDVTPIRSKGSMISSTRADSDGLVPMLRVFNNTAMYVDQSRRRKGAFAIYLETWHADIFDWLDLKKNHGLESKRARDLFYALWTSDLFMERVESDEDWCLMDPKLCRRLPETYGDEFAEAYKAYEREGRYVRKIRARELWNKILDAQIETGTPYLLFKDAANIKSNQKNLGTIRCSNLCAEIIQFTSPDEVAVCTLASICLGAFARKTEEVGDNAPSGTGVTVDYEKLFEVARHVARRLDCVITINSYPIPEARTSSMAHRPIAVGMQGLQNLFYELFVPFDSDEARHINAYVAAVIYYGAVTASVDAAERYGPYSTFEGSPASKGQLQFDLWGVEPLSSADGFVMDWHGLKVRMVKFGLRNSLLTAFMPTASTSTLKDNYESFEPAPYLCYLRGTDAGEFVVWNRHLHRELRKRGLWTSEIVTAILRENGSVQNVEGIPDDVKKVFRTIFEIKVRPQIDMSAARGPYVDQSQSLNINFKIPTHQMLTSSHFHAWKSGLKTGCYYVRREAPKEAIQFTIESASSTTSSTSSAPPENGPVCTLAMIESGCESCSG